MKVIFSLPLTSIIIRTSPKKRKAVPPAVTLPWGLRKTSRSTKIKSRKISTPLISSSAREVSFKNSAKNKNKKFSKLTSPRSGPTTNIKFYAPNNKSASSIKSSPCCKKRSSRPRSRIWTLTATSPATNNFWWRRWSTWRRKMRRWRIWWVSREISWRTLSDKLRKTRKQ